MSSATPRGSIPGATVVGRYRVERFLGAGGMADVYVARDLQLGRLVALKILRATDPARIERFVREAQLASSLNHPAIVSVYDAGTVDSTHYLAMELVEGQTLDVWTRSTRDVRKIAEVLAAIADGLARAHASGIVHRDLKPQNLMVAFGGHPKILDFGVAKLTDPDPSNGDRSNTAPSHALGTGAYMSPEQVEGAVVDHRSDIFSFGAVAYEAFTGKSPFERGTVVESMHAVLHDAPPPPSLGAELTRIIRKCLVKDRDERFQSIKDVALDLREAARENAMSAPMQKRRLLPAMGALLLAVTLAILSVFFVRDRQSSTLVAKPTKLAQPVMMRMTNTGKVSAGAVTPDGKYIVHATIDGEEQSVWVKQIATGTNVRIIPPDRLYYTDFEVSSDGNYVYYAVASQAEPNIVDLRQIPILGGQSRVVARDMEGYFSVSPDGKRVVFLRFNAFERLYKMTMADLESGAETILLSRPYPDWFAAMVWAPDGRSVTFLGRGQGKSKVGLFSIDVATRRITSVPTPDWPGWGGMAWLPDGSGLLLTVSEKNQPKQIWLVSNDGTARKITSDVNFYNNLSVTADSRSIVSHRADMTANIWVVSPSDPAKPRPVTTGLGNCFGAAGLRWMPDGKLLYTVCGSTNTLNLIDASGGEPRALMRGRQYWHPAVSPDGKRIAVVSERPDAEEEIWVGDVNASENELKQLTHNGPVSWPSWAPDGRSIYYATRGTEQAVWRVWLDGRAERVIATPTNSPAVSPDGKSILCRMRSTDPKTPLWRTAIVPLAGGQPRFVDVPRSGGPPRPQWSRDGKSFLYLDYVDGVANIWKQDLRGGEPRQLTRFDSGEIIHFDVATDGTLAVSHGERVSDIVLIRDFR